MILAGDVREKLAELPDESVQVCCTSPPYYGLRKYGDDPRQLGLEETPEQYVASMVDVFREVRRVLRKDGLLWLNLGDCYAGSGKGPTGHNGIGNQGKRHSTETRAKMSEKASRPKPERRQERHPLWRGSEVSQNIGRDRARRWHEKPAACERCGGAKKLDWHHIDENPLNNERDNLKALCRKCHQEVDGRAEFLRSGRVRRKGVKLA